MAVYFANTEITGIKDLFPLTAKDITGLYFANTELFTVWATYDGALPATYSANGSMLADYRVYGSAGGVGDRTVNLFDVNVEQGGWTGQNGMTPTKYGTDNPSFYYTRCRGDSIYAIDPEKQYTISFFPKTLQASVKLLNLVGKQIADTGWGNDHTVTGAYGICFSIRNSTNSKIIPNDIQGITITEGSTAPAEYVPYGYELDMSVSDGTTSTTTPIYIGDTPLGEDEYVDYAAGKVYRRPNLLNMNTLEPGYLATDGAVHTPSSASMVTDYMEVTPGTYILSVSRTNNLYSQNARYVNYYNTNKEYLGYSSYTPSPVLKDTSHAFTISNPNIKHVKITLDVAYTKAVFHIKNPAPTDPPVPLPALPTVDGTNIVDYAGQSAAVPSRFYAKYRKEGFK